ncbi:hypothetical protein Q7C36_000009 [Tachysurus vachellii]|uniref:Uncharacterized protein n=1 Tax=Tachysurus vachellii TaxID=175792 RepID=A0AA88P113_TACVA|nr:hypothetical protein Q7C36_009371 [Tachysurus vachellii]KAK2868138.1 hypothetical protein Q7C36_000009 [Tachysurus vachellii]
MSGKTPMYAPLKAKGESKDLGSSQDKESTEQISSSQKGKSEDKVSGEPVVGTCGESKVNNEEASQKP